MRLHAALRGDLRRYLTTEIRGAERAVTAGVREATNGLKLELRKQVVDAGLGKRIGNAWRAKVYPEREQSAEAAGFVWSKAPQIHAAFDKGPVIVPQHADMLAIPTPEAVRLAGGKRVTPDELARRFGPLTLIRTRRGVPLLVMDMRARRGKRGGFSVIHPGRRVRSGLTTVIMYFLSRRAVLRKRLDIAGAARRWAARLPDLIVKHWPEEAR